MAKALEDLSANDLAEMGARYAPTPLGADLSLLSEGDRAALAKLTAAARLLDDVFLHQVWEGNPSLLERLQADPTPLGRERLRYFLRNKGPWSRIDDDAPFIPGVPAPKPEGANYYPADMTRAEFEAWLATLSEGERAVAKGFYHTIRRAPGGGLKAVPYSKEYAAFLAPAADLLRQAAALTENATLSDFLRLRAEAFTRNDYFQSELAWLDVEAPLDITIGPYETYEDGLFGYKAAFEAHLGVVDQAGTSRLASFSSRLQEIEDSLPLAERYRNPRVSTVAPIKVIDLVLAAGDGNSGPMAAAFNLPNDERVADAKGYKRVTLRNVQQAKFAQVLTPIAARVLVPEQLADVSFDEFFNFILLHELAHGLGPQSAELGGLSVSLREALRELYSPIEEAKADAVSLFATQLFFDRGVMSRQRERAMYATYLAGAFRSVRFGIGEAHGKGVALQFNYLSDEGAIAYDPGAARFAVDPERAKAAIRKLAAELLTIEAEGSYEKARGLLERYAVLRPEMRRALDRLAGLPVDIEPQFRL